MSTPKWNSIILDSNPSDSRILKNLLHAYCPQVKVQAEVAEVAEAVSSIQLLEPNLVFCNVTLQNGNSFEVLDQLEQYNGNLIFLASDEKCAIKAFRYNAFDYLLKPVTSEILIDVLERLEVRAHQLDQRMEAPEDPGPKKKFATIILNAAGVQHVVHISDIIHLEGDGNYSTVHLSGGDKILVSKPLKYFEDVLPARHFFRVHQSHIVNLANVKSVQNGDAQVINLSNGNVSPLARRKKDQFLSWLARQ